MPKLTFVAQRLLFPCTIAVIWETAHRLELANPTLLPSVGDVFGAMGDLFFRQPIWIDLWYTFLRTGAGFLLALVVGVAVGLAMGVWRPLYEVMATPVDFFRSVPVTALYPIFVFLLGISHLSKIGMIFVACVFVVALNTAYGVRQANPTRRQMARLYGASELQGFTLITVFESLPQTLIGLRIAISYAVIVSILCEMFMGSQLGLGQRLIEAYTKFSAPEMYAIVLIIGTLGFLANRVFVSLEDHLAPWVGK